MELDNTIKFIENIYNSYNISHSLVVYRKNETTSSDIKELYQRLIDNDFPVYDLQSIPSDLSSQETNYRMFLIDYDDFEDFILNKNKDFSNISVIFCLSPSLLHTVCELLRSHKVKTIQSMHLFSC